MITIEKIPDEKIKGLYTICFKDELNHKISLLEMLQNIINNWLLEWKQQKDWKKIK